MNNRKFQLFVNTMKIMNLTRACADSDIQENAWGVNPFAGTGDGD